MSAEAGLDLFGVAWRLGATLFFVLLNGYFVAAEFALVKVRRSRVTALAEEGRLSARTADHILRHLDHYLSACQLGITIASLVLGALGEPAVSRVLIAAAAGVGWEIPPDDPLLHGAALVVAFSIITLLHMTLGEQAPKMAALQQSERTSLAAAIPLRIFAAVFRPFIALVNGSSNALLRSAGLRPEHGFESSHTAEEIRHILSHSAKAGHITERQWELTENVFGLMDLEARHILVPRVDVVYLTLEKDVEENLRRMRASGHSRFPLCEVGLDTVVGFVHIKDAFHVPGGGLPDLRALARPAVFVPETQPLSELIVELQRQRSHCAVVLDEHGTATGLVFLEDALEEIVGPMSDEFDRSATERVVQEIAPGCYELPGNLPLPEAQEALDLELEEAPEDTIGGHVVAQLGRMARRGDELELGNYRVSVVEVGRRRIARLRFERRPIPPNETGADA
jgi:CBS domain containing-hemolysin-like protein